MTGRFEGHEPAGGQDSAGVPWAGRTLQGTGFDRDDGQADPMLVASLTRLASAHGSDDEIEEQMVAAVAATSRARLIVPIVALPGESASSDMAAVTLSGPQGRKALPVFTSIEELAAWDARARPVPVTAQRAALAAVQEGCDVMVLDVGTPLAAELRTSMVWALAMGRDWSPAHRDDQVATAVAAAIRTEPQIADWSLHPGQQGALVVEVALAPDLVADQINELLQRVAQQIATDGEVRARIDALRFRLVDQADP